MFQSQVAGASGQLDDAWWGRVGGLLPKPTTKLEKPFPITTAKVQQKAIRNR